MKKDYGPNRQVTRNIKKKPAQNPQATRKSPRKWGRKPTRNIKRNA